MKKTILLSSTLLIIDIIIKIIVKKFMIVNESIKLIDDFFYITYVKNNGAAFSILKGKKIFLIIFSLIIIISLIIYLYKKKDVKKLESVSYSLLLAGAIGNLIDRIVYGYVVDYFNFYIFNYDFPIFNLADSFIVIGILLLFVVEGGSNHGIKSSK